jgi:hypothetical protein
VENPSPSLLNPIGKMPLDVIHTARFTNAVEVDDLGHSAPYPSRLIETFISATTEPGFVVCDPFSGSATTGQVALENGCYFISYEVNPKFVEMGRNRLKRGGRGNLAPPHRMRCDCFTLVSLLFFYLGILLLYCLSSQTVLHY